MLLRSSIALIIFCLLFLSMVESGVMNSPTVILDLSVSTFNSISFCFTFLQFCYSTHTHLELSSFPGGSTLYHSLYNVLLSFIPFSSLSLNFLYSLLPLCVCCFFFKRREKGLMKWPPSKSRGLLLCLWWWMAPRPPFSKELMSPSIPCFSSWE